MRPEKARLFLGDADPVVAAAARAVVDGGAVALRELPDEARRRLSRREAEFHLHPPALPVPADIGEAREQLDDEVSTPPGYHAQSEPIVWLTEERIDAHLADEVARRAVPVARRSWWRRLLRRGRGRA